ncbi:MAG: tRNA pseudouridine synthase, partial [Frankiales bacterium]|nr:tRNA pseudouridine synthase [Frankiales bacterium]
QTTVTDDAEGDVVQERPVVATDDDIAREVAVLTGDLLQVPSSVSAIKVDGVRSYARVRAGESVELKARPVTVSAFDVVARRGDELDVSVTCTSGTYIRALARDLGAALGCGGHLTSLRRTRVGPFDLSRAAPLEPWEDGRVVLLDDAVRASFPSRELTEEEAVAVSYGKKLEPAPGIAGAFDPQGRCVALVEDGRPLVVFRPA